MKSTNKILLAAMVVATLTFVNSTSAAEPLMSPRAKANAIKTVSGVTEDKLERGILPGSPKGRELAASLRKVPGTTEDRIDRSVATLSGKARELFGSGAKAFYVAPVK